MDGTHARKSTDVNVAPFRDNEERGAGLGGTYPRDAESRPADAGASRSTPQYGHNISPLRIEIGPTRSEAAPISLDHDSTTATPHCGRHLEDREVVIGGATNILIETRGRMVDQ